MAAARLVHFYSDSACAVRALTQGSANLEVHEAAMEVLDVAGEIQVQLLAHWMPRTSAPVRMTDFLSKHHRLHDFRLGARRRVPSNYIDAVFGPHAIDLMASEHSGAVTRRTTGRFLTWFYAPGTSGIDAFACDWRRLGHGFCHPPWGCVGRAISHARSCRARVTFVLPFTPEATWWPLLQLPQMRRAVTLPPQRGQLTCAGLPIRPRFPLVVALFDFGSD